MVFTVSSDLYLTTGAGGKNPADMADKMWSGLKSFITKRSTQHVKNVNITIFFTTDDSVYKGFKGVFHAQAYPVAATVSGRRSILRT